MNITLSKDRARTIYRSSASQMLSKELTELQQLHRHYNRTAETYHNLFQIVSNQPDIEFHDYWMTDETDNMIVGLETLNAELHNINLRIEELT